MDDLTTFSFRIPKPLARSVEAEAKRSGVNRSEYTRRALEELNHRLMQERITELSLQLTSQSATSAQAMESSTSDGLA